MLNIKKIIQQIIKDYSVIKFVFIQSGDEYCQANGEQLYINNCYISLNELYVGIYEDKNLMVMGILHQIGHLIQSNNMCFTKYQQEIHAWNQAYKLTKRYSIQITPEIKKYVQKCLESYNRKLNFTSSTTELGRY